MEYSSRCEAKHLAKRRMASWMGGVTTPPFKRVLSVVAGSVAGMQDWCAAERDPVVVERYRAKLVVVTGSECLWWKGAISGGGHGRFYVATAWSSSRTGSPTRSRSESRHCGRRPRCEPVRQPLCQRVDPEHVGGLHAGPEPAGVG